MKNQCAKRLVSFSAVTSDMWMWYAPAYPDCLGWTWPAYYWQDDQAVVHPSKSLCRGQRWPLWAQTLKD